MFQRYDLLKNVVPISTVKLYCTLQIKSDGSVIWQYSNTYLFSNKYNIRVKWSLFLTKWVEFWPHCLCCSVFTILSLFLIFSLFKKNSAKAMPSRALYHFTFSIQHALMVHSASFPPSSKFSCKNHRT